MKPIRPMNCACGAHASFCANYGRGPWECLKCHEKRIGRRADGRPFADNKRATERKEATHE